MGKFIAAAVAARPRSGICELSLSKGFQDSHSGICRWKQSLLDGESKTTFGGSSNTALNLPIPISSGNESRWCFAWQTEILPTLLLAWLLKLYGRGIPTRRN